MRVRLAAALVACASVVSGGVFNFQAKQTLVLGDSITYDGHWVEYVQAALIAAGHPPAKPFANCALPSETVSGLSEAGHAGGKFPRPDLHERLGRVLALVKPDQVIASYGENDGIYEVFSEARFKAYRDGIAWLRSEVAATGASLILLTPTGFDPIPIPKRVAAAGKEDAAHPFEGYDQVLARYAEWLTSLRKEGVLVVDVHSAFARALEGRRKTRPSFSFAEKDGVHPNPAGHAVVAQAVILAIGLPPGVADRPLAWAEKPPSTVTLLRDQDTVLKNAWLTAAGHKRPGMKPGIPLPEALAMADQLGMQIFSGRQDPTQ